MCLSFFSSRKAWVVILDFSGFSISATPEQKKNISQKQRLLTIHELILVTHLWEPALYALSWSVGQVSVMLVPGFYQLLHILGESTKNTSYNRAQLSDRSILG